MSVAQVFEQFSQASPLPVMARATLEHAVSDEMLDNLFTQHASRQVSGALLFSAVVRLMTLVVCRVHPSVNAAYQKQAEPLNVSLQAVYAKLRGIEPQVTRALVRETAARLSAVADELHADLEPPFPGYANRVLDGAHLAATEHRLKELREIAAGPLPGLGLCVLDPARQMILDFIPCEDAYRQERSLLEILIDDFEPGQVWIADRNFCTAMFVWEVHTSQACFVVREHAQNVRWTATDAETACGTTESGEVFEQAIVIHDDFGGRFAARRVRVALAQATRDGDREMTILTNLPSAVSAAQVAEGYRRRWTIETAFAVVQKCLEGEIATLGYPRAALFSYGMALFSYNVLHLQRAALRAAHGEETIEESFSTHHMAEEIHMVWRGMTLLLTAAFWQHRYGKFSPSALAKELKRLAALVNLKHYRKVKRTSRKPPPKRSSSESRPHVSTARLLAKRK